MPSSGYSTKLKKVSVIGNGSRIHCNEGNYVSDNSNSGDAFYVFNVEDFTLRNLWIDNSIVEVCTLKRCKNFLVEDCIFSNSAICNGFSAIDYVSTDEDMYKSGCRGLVRNCKAFGNKEYGMTTYCCSGITFENCHSYGNGNDDSDYSSKYSRYDSGGGFSSEAGTNGEDSIAQSNIVFKNCVAEKNVGNGWHIDASGTSLLNCCAKDSIYPSRYESSELNEMSGCGIYVNGNNASILNCKVFNNGRNGITVFRGSNADKGNIGFIVRDSEIFNNSKYEIYSSNADVSIFDTFITHPTENENDALLFNNYNDNYGKNRAIINIDNLNCNHCLKVIGSVSTNIVGSDVSIIDIDSTNVVLIVSSVINNYINLRIGVVNYGISSTYCESITNNASGNDVFAKAKSKHEWKLLGSTTNDDTWEAITSETKLDEFADFLCIGKDSNGNIKCSMFIPKVIFSSETYMYSGSTFVGRVIRIGTYQYQARTTVGYTIDVYGLLNN